MLATINYQSQTIVVRDVLTHADYDRMKLDQ
jgi:mRNA-degrading endonuclease HigB of HigAB toxin-antitoxin module